MKIHNVEQGTDEWFAIRSGRPTASEFSNLITSTGEASKSLPAYAARLAAELYAGKPVDSFEGNAWTQRGNELEDAALSLYGLQMDCEPEKVGFVTDDDELYGCSPDAFANDGMVEIKCLKTENHVKAILYHKKHGRCPTDYVQQTQGQMFITGRKWCDLVFYHPELPMLIIRQEPDKKVVDGLIVQLNNVLEERDKILQVLREV